VTLLVQEVEKQWEEEGGEEEEEGLVQEEEINFNAN
jgi:hypothetical protein